jgi:hypothetical protein
MEVLKKWSEITLLRLWLGDKLGFFGELGVDYKGVFVVSLRAGLKNLVSVKISTVCLFPPDSAVFPGQYPGF